MHQHLGQLEEDKMLKMYFIHAQPWLMAVHGGSGRKLSEGLKVDPQGFEARHMEDVKAIALQLKKKYQQSVKQFESPVANEAQFFLVQF